MLIVRVTEFSSELAKRTFTRRESMATAKPYATQSAAHAATKDVSVDLSAPPTHGVGSSSSSSSRSSRSRRHDEERELDGGSNRARSRSPPPPEGQQRPPPPRDILLVITAFDAGQQHQLCGPAMVKTKAVHTVESVLATFCRWSGLRPEQVGLHDGSGAKLVGEQTVQGAGLRNGSAVSVVLTAGATPPRADACSHRFAMLDVLDSELAAISEGLQM